MGGELGIPGAKPPGLGHSVQGESGGGAPWFTNARRKREVRGGRSPPVYKCTAYKGCPWACPQFGRLG